MMEVKTKEELQELLSSNTGKLVLMALEDEEPSSNHLLEVAKNLSEDFKSLKFKCVNHGLLSDVYTLKSVPTVLFLEGKNVVNSLEGCGTSVLVTFVRNWSHQPHESTVEKIKRLLSAHPVLLFLKGDKEEPFCRFSRAVVEMLNKTGVKFEGYNIFEDANLREELKKFSNWPTYPQLYVKGNLIGGHDIIKELYENNTLKNEIPPECLK